MVGLVGPVVYERGRREKNPYSGWNTRNGETIDAMVLRLERAHRSEPVLLTHKDDIPLLKFKDHMVLKELRPQCQKTEVGCMNE